MSHVIASRLHAFWRSCFELLTTCCPLLDVHHNVRGSGVVDYNSCAALDAGTPSDSDGSPSHSGIRTTCQIRATPPFTRSHFRIFCHLQLGYRRSRYYYKTRRTTLPWFDRATPQSHSATNARLNMHHMAAQCGPNSGYEENKLDGCVYTT